MPTYRPLYVGLQHSEALTDVYVNSPADDPVLITVELHHPDWATPIRAVNKWEPLLATLESTAPVNPSTEVTFAGIPFTFFRPAEGDSGAPAAVALVVDNLSTEITTMIMEVQESEEPIYAMIRTYLPSDTSAPHEMPVMKMWVQTPVTITSGRAQMNLSFGDLTNRRFPGLVYKRSNQAVASSSGVSWSTVDKSGNIDLSSGNLTATDPLSAYASVRCTAAPTSGKWYWEIVAVSLAFDLDLFIGLMSVASNWNSNPPNNFPRYFYRSTGDRYDDNITAAYPELTAGDNVGIAWDVDADEIWYRLNGTWLNSGDPEAGTNPSSTGEVTTETMSPAVGFDNNFGSASVTAKFSSASWVYEAPTGFLELVA